MVESFSVAWRDRHLNHHPDWGPSLLVAMSDTYKCPWLGSSTFAHASGAEMATHVGVLFCCLVHQAVKGPTWLGPSLLLDVSGA